MDVRTAQQSNEKADKFRTLGEKRVTKVLNAIRRIGNLSRRSTYAYTQAEIEQMFTTLRAELDAAEKKFADHQKAAFRFE
jgi:transcription elongation GreA/GreB family factor